MCHNADMEPVTSNTRVTLLDTAERVGTTFAEAVLVYVIAGLTADNTADAFWRGLLVAAVVAAANAIKVLLTTWVPVIDSWLWDTVYRAVSTFVVAAAGSLVSVQFLDLVDIGFWRGVGLAALTAALSVVKSGIASRRPPGVTPASLVTRTGDLAA